MLRNVLIVIVAALLFAPAVSASEHIVIDAFEAGGGFHDTRHPDTVEGVNTLQATREAVERAIEVFQPLWIDETGRLPFSFFIDVQPEARSDSGSILADAGIIASAELPAPVLAANGHSRLPQICRINIYLATLSTEESLALFHMAHELAHCYQEFYDPDLLDLSESVRGWWVEGSAEWMAGLAYPDLAPVRYTGWHRVFADTPAMFNRSYNNVFYWIYLETHLGGAQAVVEFIKGLRGLNTPQRYAAYLDAEGFDGFTYDFAIALARNSVASQPAVSDLLSTWDFDAGDFPSNIGYSTDAYAFQIYQHRISGLTEDQGVQYTPTHFASGSYRISVEQSGGYTELTDGEAFKLCPDSESFNHRLIVTRGSQPADEADFSPNLRVESVDCDEEETPSTTGIPECMVGTWTVTQLPYLPGMEDVTMSGLQQVTVDAEGNTITTYDDFTQSIPMEFPGNDGPLELVLNGTVTGKITLDETGKVSNAGETDFAVQAVASLPGGMTMDMTSMVQEMAGVGLGMPSDAIIVCVDDNTLHLNITAGGFSGTTVLER